MIKAFTDTRLFKLSEKMVKEKEMFLFRVVFNSAQVKEEIIYLNTEEQLFEKGVDSKGVRIGDYSPFTIMEKVRKNQRYDHITLKDTGQFYDSWTVKIGRGFIELNASPIKDEDNLFEIYGEDVLGLTNESIEKLKPLLIEQYRYHIEKLL